MSGFYDDFDDDSPDVERKQRFSLVLNGMSPQVSGPYRIPGASAGDILVRLASGDKVFRGTEGVVVQTIGFHTLHMQWPPRSAGGHPIAHYRHPREARWAELPTGDVGYWMSNGDRVRATVYATVLIGGEKAVFPFQAPADAMGADFAAAAGAIKVSVDGCKPKQCIGAKFRILSYSETSKRVGKPYFALGYEFVARYGDPAGPTLEEVRAGLALRHEILLEEEARRLEWKQSEEQRRIGMQVSATPTLGVPIKGSSIITSGTHWADPNLGKDQSKAPSDPDDSLDNMPWMNPTPKAPQDSDKK